MLLQSNEIRFFNLLYDVSNTGGTSTPSGPSNSTTTNNTSSGYSTNSSTVSTSNWGLGEVQKVEQTVVKEEVSDKSIFDSDSSSSGTNEVSENFFTE